MLDRHTCWTDKSLAHAAEKITFSATKLQQRIKYKTLRNVDKKRLVTIILRLTYVIAVQDMHRKLNEVELH